MSASDWRAPHWPLIEFRAGRLSLEALIVHVTLFERADPAKLDGRRPTPVATLEQLIRWTHYEGDRASFQRLVRRERDRGRLAYAVAGRSYSFSLTWSLVSAVEEAACPPKADPRARTRTGIAASAADGLSAPPDPTLSAPRACLSAMDGAENGSTTRAREAALSGAVRGATRSKASPRTDANGEEPLAQARTNAQAQTRTREAEPQSASEKTDELLKLFDEGAAARSRRGAYRNEP